MQELHKILDWMSDLISDHQKILERAASLTSENLQLKYVTERLREQVQQGGGGGGVTNAEAQAAISGMHIKSSLDSTQNCILKNGITCFWWA